MPNPSRKDHWVHGVGGPDTSGYFRDVSNATRKASKSPKYPVDWPWSTQVMDKYGRNTAFNKRPDPRYGESIMNVDTKKPMSVDEMIDRVLKGEPVDEVLGAVAKAVGRGIGVGIRKVVDKYKSKRK